jgi:tetratricopeptide (TPR) repeat protein
MKSEDRHKMQRNELADWLAKSIEQVKPFSNLIFLVVVLILLLVGAFMWWMRQSADRDAVAWAEYDRAAVSGDPKDLDEIGDLHAGSEVAQWAAVAAGDAYLGTGCEELFRNKSAATAALKDAVDHYRTVQEQGHTPELLERASFGLARAYEAQAGDQGDLDTAIEAYQEVVDKWPDGAYSEMAARRLEDLGREETKAFYDKFAQFNPQPASPDGPGTGSAGDGSAFDINKLLDETTFPESEPAGEPDPEADQTPPGDGPSMPEDSEAADSAPPEGDAQPAGDSTGDQAPSEEPPGADPPADPAPSKESSEPSP